MLRDFRKLFHDLIIRRYQRHVQILRQHDVFAVGRRAARPLRQLHHLLRWHIVFLAFEHQFGAFHRFQRRLQR